MLRHITGPYQGGGPTVKQIARIYRGNATRQLSWRSPPLYRRRRMMKNLIMMLSAATLLMLSVSGCLTTKAEKGGLGGAAAGAVAGQAIGRNTEATLLGAAIGGMLGYVVGNEMDKADRQKVAHTYETVPDGQTNTWVNPNTQTRYQVTPQDTYQRGGRPCREAVILATIDGRPEKVHQTACRDSQGKWIVQGN